MSELSIAQAHKFIIFLQLTLGFFTFFHKKQKVQQSNQYL